MKILIVFYTQPETSPSNGFFGAVAAVILFVFNLVSVAPILKFVHAGGGSLRMTMSRSYQIGCVMAVSMDAVIVLFCSCAFAHMMSFVDAIRGMDVDIMVYLPCTYLFPIFALCNELTQVARGRIELNGGVCAMALQCVFAIPLHFALNLVLPVMTHNSVRTRDALSGWPALMLTVTTLVLVACGTQVMLGCSEHEIESAPV